ncbi:MULTISPECIES: hypothetical protein [unclassified Pseudoalteromonas]|jgi:uncharacterized membrane protein|uniref:hypothetical protein n=1 Tax=unclassified Pseudoalteromonas TaxID=194690 RepID=UPI0023596D47|nr:MULTISPECIES: hypothetical protein [unclassified Pseudoalteromonas]MCP4058145.1 hypothetical protein [Pseudoalteromonas sp.]MDC9502851.1 hypothetical protein [Pseudoalteromonas sp. Angola-18]MDC9530293.1 hypothetical protein [Pseudoalteromonas sp. Angola-7]MDC9563389.1 hypothetical protein [Pseudoalteromonas sp. GAB2316C]MDC9572129.1 hypothetical protein [Pseudoalteromonas sp. GABNS16A]|tara:strand:+ start:36566 stop:36826 length:261 start_codon:yes stop_codon:yes gene_type:complete
MENNKKNFDQILVELVLLAILVGFIPSLIVGAFEDSFGVCISPLTAICHQLQVQGLVKAICALVCAVAAVVVSFTISKQYNKKEDK